MKPIATGSCYLDKGESHEYVTAQLMRMAKMKPEFYFFDIICRPDQLVEATELMMHFYRGIGEHIPGLLTNRIYTGITCDNEVRPAMMAMLMMNKGRDGIVDINPGRKPR